MERGGKISRVHTDGLGWSQWNSERAILVLLGGVNVRLSSLRSIRNLLDIPGSSEKWGPQCPWHTCEAAPGVEAGPAQVSEGWCKSCSAHSWHCTQCLPD